MLACENTSFSIYFKHMNININKYFIPTAIIIAGVLVAGAYVYVKYFPLDTLSPQAAAEKAIAFINENIEEGAVASLVSITKEDNVYKINLEVNETPYESYITKDGKFLFPTGINLEGAASEPTAEATTEEIVTASASFAQCLTEKGLKFYGAWWCGHCQNQKKMFGDAFQYVDYVECEKTPGTSQGDMTDACKTAKIESFPTWQLPDGTKQSGEMSLEKLSEVSGCSL